MAKRELSSRLQGMKFMQRGKARENPPAISTSSPPATDASSPANLAARSGAGGSSSAPPALRGSRVEGSGMRAGRVEDVEEGWTAASSNAGMDGGGVNPMFRHGCVLIFEGDPSPSSAAGRMAFGSFAAVREPLSDDLDDDVTDGPPPASAAADTRREGGALLSQRQGRREGKRQRSSAAEHEGEEEWEDRQKGRSRAGGDARRHTSGDTNAMTAVGSGEGREHEEPSASTKRGGGNDGSNNNGAVRQAVGASASGGLQGRFATASDDAKKDVKLDWRERRPAKNA